MERERQDGEGRVTKGKDRGGRGRGGELAFVKEKREEKNGGMRKKGEGKGWIGGWKEGRKCEGEKDTEESGGGGLGVEEGKKRGERERKGGKWKRWRRVSVFVGKVERE